MYTYSGICTYLLYTHTHTHIPIVVMENITIYFYFQIKRLLDQILHFIYTISNFYSYIKPSIMK